MISVVLLSAAARVVAGDGKEGGWDQNTLPHLDQGILYACAIVLFGETFQYFSNKLLYFSHLLIKA